MQKPDNRTTPGNLPAPTVDDRPLVSCLCPTYRRPELLANVLACYSAQDYAADRRELVILDDAGQFAPQQGPGWELISTRRRFRTLPEKFNALAGLARGEVFVVWEDDDIYLPWHISAHVEALQSGCRFSKSSRILTHAGGALQSEPADGRFHGSIAFTRGALESVGGWPLTRRGDFDQTFLARLAADGPIGDPFTLRPPSYVFRWELTHAYHGQELMRGPEDEEWYERACGLGSAAPTPCLTPRFDADTAAYFTQLGIADPILIGPPVPRSAVDEDFTTAAPSSF